MQCRREPAERNSVVEEAAVIPLLTYDKQEEEEEEEAVFIRGVNTNEDSPNEQHAPHRSVQDTGAMSA